MTTGVRLLSMHIDAFRGISDPIDFDFTSPITLVFAPNGTGKTTLCEAAEWLLTGQVERLRNKKDFDPAVLKSKFTDDDRHPLVRANIMVTGKERQITRTAAGSHQEARVTEEGSEGKVIGPHELLSFLAPAAAAQEAHHLRAINLRQRWLRGTRFLSAEALAALVDSDDETIERRTQVFADLLGIRHLLDAEKLCDQFITDLGSRERNLSQTIAGQEAEITSLNTALDAQAERSGGTSAAAEVAAAEMKLGFAVDEIDRSAGTLADRIEALNIEHGRRDYRLTERTSALEAVAAEWTSRVEIEVRLSELTEREAELAKRLAKIESNGRNAASAVSEAASRQERLSEQVRALATAKESLSRLVVAMLTAVANLPLGSVPPPRATLGSLVSLLPESGWTENAIGKRQADIRAAINAERDSADENRRLELLKAQLEFSARLLISEEALAMLRAEVAELEAAAAAARRRLEATSDPIVRLQAAGRDLLEHEHEESSDQCPLCSHHWGTSKHLRQAIARTLSTVPELTKLAQEVASSASEAARLAKARLDEALRRSSEAARMRSDIQGLEASATGRRHELDRLGVSPTDPLGSLADAEKRLSAAAALSALLRERERVDPTLPGSPSPILQYEAPVLGLLDQLEAAMAARDQVVQLELATTAKDQEDRAAARNRLRDEHAVTQQALRDCRQELAQLRPGLERLRRLWETAVHDLSWSPEALAATRKALAAERRLLSDVAAHSAAAQAAWSVEVRRARLVELNDAVKPLRPRLEHMSLRIAAAKRAKATFHETYNEVSKRQIEDLSRVVNPLFARMHANRVFDKIKLGQTDDPLRWLADAGRQELDPGKDFSQGQRQDLALALFLARARSLGGTFFLDEPVTHLDDLNRVGLLDIFRATVMESSSSVNLVITTASKTLARHLIEKFSAVGAVNTPAGRAGALSVIELDGNGRTGVAKRTVFAAAVA